MKAVILKKYSQQMADLSVTDVAKPQLAPHQVLVRVKYAGVNPLDNMTRQGQVKLLVKQQFPLVLGNEFSGLVEEVGTSVTRFKKGDRVYGRTDVNQAGAFAEYLAVSEDFVAKIPNYLDFAQAAAVPLTALTAYQALELLEPKKSETLFISGGTGGFGLMAIPLAKSRGLRVITNGSGKNENLVRNLGADVFIDYKKADYVDQVKSVDYVIDTLGGSELTRQFGILKQGGSLVSLRGLPNGRFAKSMGLSLTKQILFTLVGARYDRLARKAQQTYHFLFVKPNGQQLEEISTLFEKQKIPVAIDSVFELSEVNQALSRVKSGGGRGKVILKIGE